MRGIESKFNPYHNSIIQSLCEIDIHAISDFITESNIKIEFKESTNRTYLDKRNMKKYNKISFTLHKKDFNSHDFFIFHEVELNNFYVVRAKLIDNKYKNSKIKDSTSISLNFIIKNGINYNYESLKKFLNEEY